MPIPPHLSNALSTTPGGVSYATLREPGFSMQGASDANQLDIRVIIGHEDLEEFTQEIVGYAEWDGTSPTLQRTLPLQCPLIPGLWCDSWKHVKWGGWVAGEMNADAFADNWPTAQWCELALTFTRPKWWVRSDDTLSSSHGNKEQFRFAAISRRYTPREQKLPGQYLEVNSAADGSGTWQTIDIASFVPVYDTEILIQLIEWPIEAFNESLSAACTGCVNYDTFATGDGFSYPPGLLLYRGITQPLNWFQNAAGDFVVSPILSLVYKPGGWNHQLLPTRTADTPPERKYGLVRLRGTTNPPYASVTFQDIVTPSGP